MSASMHRTEKPEENGGNVDVEIDNDLRKVTREESSEQSLISSKESPRIKVKSATELNNAINENITSAARSLPNQANVIIHRPIVVKVEPECAKVAVDAASVTEKDTNTNTLSQNVSNSKVSIAANTESSSGNETGNVPTETSCAATTAEECVRIKVEPFTEAVFAKTTTIASSIDSETGNATMRSPIQATNVMEKITKAATSSLENNTERVTTPHPPSIPTTVQADPITEGAVAEKVTATVESSLENEPTKITTLGESTKQAAVVALVTDPVRIEAEPLTKEVASVTVRASLGHNPDHVATATTIQAETSAQDTNTVGINVEQIVEASSSPLDSETEQATNSHTLSTIVEAYISSLGNVPKQATVTPSITTTFEADPIRIKPEPSTEDAIAEKEIATAEFSLGQKTAHIATATTIQVTNTIAEQSAEASTSSLGNPSEQATVTPLITNTVETEPIKIKPEPETREVAQPAASDDSMDSTEDGEIPDLPLPDDFFEDLLKSADDIKAAAMSPPRPTEESSTKRQDIVTGANAAADTIPDHFFDDLLVDRVAERLADAADDDLETKYSEKLKELKKLEKKNKKAKKKSHKSSHKKRRERTRSRSNSSERRRHKRHRSRSRSHSVEKRIKVKSEFTSSYGSLNKAGSLFPHDLYQTEAEQQKKIPIPPTIILLNSSPPAAPTRTATTSIRVKNEFSTFNPPANEDLLQCLPVHAAPATTASSDAPTTSKRSMRTIEDAGYTGFKRIKLEKVSKVAAVTVSTVDDEPELVITPKMKRQKAMLRAIATIKIIQHAEQSDEILSHFVYTPVVRKLPTSISYVTQQIYENRSPLHTINNVNFKFNSHARRFNMQEWGLEALPSWSAKIAKVLCFDANTMAAKLKAIKIPTRLQKVKKEYNEHGEEVDEVRSSFFTNAMTQTDEVSIVATGGRNRSKHSIAVQVAPNLSSCATQTDLALGTTNSNSSSRNDDLPLMQLINVLNENQLLALNDFAELIREPASSVMDLYRLRQRMLDIYKCSQLPSAMEALPSTPISNSLASNSNQPRGAYYNPQRMEQRPPTNTRPVDPRPRETSGPRLGEHRQRPTSDPRLAVHRHRPPSDPPILGQRQRPVDPRLDDQRQFPKDPRPAAYTASQQSQLTPPPPIYSPTPIPPLLAIRVHSPEFFNTSRGSGNDDQPKFFGRGGLRR